MRRIEFISFEEFQQLVKAEKKIDFKAAIILAYGSGLRISEIIGLHKLKTRCCNLEPEMRLVELKGRKVKRYYCPGIECGNEVTMNQCNRDLNDWQIMPLTSDKVDLERHQIRIDMAKGGKWRISVCSPALKPEMVSRLPIKIKRTTLQSHFKTLAKKVLGKNLSFHILRHGFGNYQANIAKLSLPIVQQLMGHSRLDTTGIYTKANPEQAINEAWKGMGGK